MNKAAPASLKLQGFEGIDNSTSDLGRPVNTWERLENFDLYLPGAIRKTKDVAVYPNDSVDYELPIWLILNYKQTPAAAMRLLGIDWMGGIYDLETGLIVFNLGFQLPDEAWYIIQQAPGRLADNSEATINWLVLGDNEGNIWAWDGLATKFKVGKNYIDSTVAILGGHLPPLAIHYIGYTNNEDRGQGIIVHRKYAVTLYNPVTKHETSPSIDVDIRSSGASMRWTNVIGPAANTVPPNYPFVSWVAFSLWLLADYVGGYTHFKLYATRDGGSELFLCTNTAILDPAHLPNPLWTPCNSDGAMPIVSYTGTEILVVDGVNDFNVPGTDTEIYIEDIAFNYSGPGQASGGVVDPPPSDPLYGNLPISTITPDSLLVTPGPDYGANDAPPLARWGVGYRGRLWLVDKNSRARLAFSKPGEFWSFPADNYIILEGDTYDDITAIKAQYDQLIIAKERSVVRLAGVDFTDFTIIPVQQHTGVLTKRGLLEFPTGLISLSRPGLMLWTGDGVKYIGLEIVDLTNTITRDNLINFNPICLFTLYDSRQQIGMLSYWVADEFKSNMILLHNDRAHPYSLYTSLPAGRFCLTGAEVEDSQNNKRLLISAGGIFARSQIIEVFAQDSDIPAVAETQWLPAETLPTRKIFKDLRVEGTLDDWVLEYKTDKFDWQPITPYTLLFKNPLGVIGNRIKLRLTNTSPNGAELSNMQVDYIDMGERR